MVSGGFPSFEGKPIKTGNVCDMRGWPTVKSLIYVCGGSRFTRYTNEGCDEALFDCVVNLGEPHDRGVDALLKQ